jgi:hypothetical protein
MKMSNATLPLASAAILLVLLSLILIRRFRARDAVPRKKHQRSSVSEDLGYSYPDSYGNFSIRNNGTTCTSYAGSESGEENSDRATCGASGTSGDDGGSASYSSGGNDCGQSSYDSADQSGM